MNVLKNIWYIIPIMIYYFIESIITGFFIFLAYKFVILPKTNFEIGYFEWVIITWIIKILLFDIYKIMPLLGNDNETLDNENEQ